jgi:hypothetical protein
MIFAFEDFELDEDLLELRRGRSRVEVQPKPLRLLFHLVRHRGRTLDKGELFDRVWQSTAIGRGGQGRTSESWTIETSGNGTCGLQSVPHGDEGQRPEPRAIPQDPEERLELLPDILACSFSRRERAHLRARFPDD